MDIHLSFGYVIRRKSLRKNNMFIILFLVMEDFMGFRFFVLDEIYKFTPKETSSSPEARTTCKENFGHFCR